MVRILVLLALAVSSPALAIEGQGSGSDINKVRRDMEAMQRDGRYQQLMEEGRANRLAFERLRAAQDPPAVGSVQRRPR